MKIYKAIPWSDLVKSLKIWSNKKGPDRIFTPQGMLAIRTSITTIKCKKTYKDTDKRTRSLLYVLKKILALIREIENNYQEQLDLPEGYYTRIKIIRKVLKQQKKISETGVSVPDRIVGISKSYIRPIVRGKEATRHYDIVLLF